MSTIPPSAEACAAAAEALREAIGTTQGVELGQLLVLERLEVMHPFNVL